VSDIAQYEDEAQAARTRLVEVVEQLSDRLSPQTIVREAKAEARQAVMDARDGGLRALMGVRDHAADAIDDAEGFVRDNAVAVGLAAAAVGVAVTIVRRAGETSSDGDPRDTYEDAGRDYATYARGDDYTADAMRQPRVSRIRDRLSDAFETVRGAASRRADAVADAREAAGQRLRRASVSASDSASAAGDRLAAGLDQVRDSATDLARRVADRTRLGVESTGDAIADHPETTILLALAAGGLLALVLGERDALADGHS